MWRATVLTIFPDMFPGPLAQSLAGKALTSNIWSLETIDIRAHATDKHRTVDDTPAGGGPGMRTPWSFPAAIKYAYLTSNSCTAIDQTTGCLMKQGSSNLSCR